MKKQPKLLLWLFLIAFTLYACSSDDSSPEPEEEMMEEEEETFTGDYFGTWNSVTPSVTFTDFPISAKFTQSAGNTNRITAQFFATGNLVSCCGSSNDGTMVINLDGNTITSFSFNDTIVDCEGSFSGDGVINAAGAFVIDFTGTDCDGSHVGQLLLRK